MGILETDFERIFGVPFFHSSFHSINLWLHQGAVQMFTMFLSDVPKSDTFVYFSTITAATWSTNNIVPVSISLLSLPSQM